MSLLPDPDEMYAIADRIAGHASAVRSLANQLGTAIAAADWHGIAADTFDLVAGDVLGSLRSAAARLDDAAAALRRHARNVRHVLDVLTRLSDDTFGLGVDLQTTLMDGLVHPGRLFGDGANLLGDVAGVAGDVGDLLGAG